MLPSITGFCAPRFVIAGLDVAGWLDNQLERAAGQFLGSAGLLGLGRLAAVQKLFGGCDAVAESVDGRSVQCALAADAHTAHVFFDFDDGDNVAERADNCFLNLVAHGAALVVRAVVVRHGRSIDIFHEQTSKILTEIKNPPKRAFYCFGGLGFMPAASSSMVFSSYDAMSS